MVGGEMVAGMKWSQGEMVGSEMVGGEMVGGELTGHRILIAV